MSANLKIGSPIPPRVLLAAGARAAVEDVHQLLEQAGLSVGWQPLDAARGEDADSPALVILDGSKREQEACQLCRRLRTHYLDSFVPIIFLAGDHKPESRLQSLDSGADTCLTRPLAPGELLAQVQAFLRLKGLHDRLTEKAAEMQRVNRKLQQTYQQLDQELELARRIQQSLLPQTMPHVPPVRFAVHYRPCGRVGGDFYDVFRLDEHHVGLYVADVMGHGIPASLLTIFLKKAIKAKEIAGQEYRLLPPSEVLRGLNREMISQALADSPFITMVYVLLNCRDGTLSFSRAGHPYPLYVPSSGAPELWKVHGTLLGIFDTNFTTQTQQLKPGDKLLLYTDGLDVLGDEAKASGTEVLMAHARKHRALPIAEFVEILARDLFAEAQQPDDFTLLGLEMQAS
jgi:sigma-B regulation protein RsbU (phosphoserine phosphatase)